MTGFWVEMREGRRCPSFSHMFVLDGTAEASTGGAISEKLAIEDNESRKLAFMAQAKLVLFCLAILCLPAFAFVPKATLVVEKANQRVGSFALGLHQGPAAAEPFITAGIPRCLYTSRTEYEHDIAGRTTRVIQITEGSPATAGSRATKTLNDCSGNAAVSASEAYLSAAEYVAHGVPLRWQLGNGLYEVSQYNAFLQLERKRIGANSSLTQGCGSAPDDQLCLEWSYGASANNGNITSSRQWARKTAGGYLNLQASFGYDGRNRLTTFNESVVSGGSSGGSWGQTNSYDRYGNRWANPSGITQSDWTPTQQSNVDAAKNQITTAKAGASTAPVTHDAAGYMTAHPQSVGSLSYDAEGRLVSGGGATYTYDGEGRRVKRVTGGGSYWYWHGADGGLIGEDTPEAVEAGVQYLSTDALGSTRLVTKGNQEVVARIDYWPFGEEIVASSAAGNRDLVSGYGGAAALKQRFTGKERDAETGLDYFGARYMSAAQGRFTSPDPLLSSGRPWMPQSWNRYAYTLNNPLRYTDPTGLYEWDASLGGSCTDKALKGGGCSGFTKQQGKDIASERKDIRKQLSKLDKSKNALLHGAATAIGKENVDNGVTIGMGAVTPGAVAQVSTTLPLTIDANGNPELDLTVATGSKGDGLFIALAHEGTHVADAQAVAGGAPTMTHMATELNAYGASVAAAQRLGWPSAGAGGTVFWSSSWSKVDQQIIPPQKIRDFLNTNPMYAPKVNNPAFRK